MIHDMNVTHFEKMALDVIPCFGAPEFLTFIDPKSCICRCALNIYSDQSSLFIHVLC